jgi:hypothetical protein
VDAVATGWDGTGAWCVRPRRLAWALLASARLCQSSVGPPAVVIWLVAFFTAAAVTGAVPGPLAPRRKQNPAGRARRLSIHSPRGHSIETDPHLRLPFSPETCLITETRYIFKKSIYKIKQSVI